LAAACGLDTLPRQYCTDVIDGNASQGDLRETSGLRTVIHRIKSKMLPVPIIEFTLNDIVRSGICEMWVRAFEEVHC
jgi:phosphate starvation-inducible PhoH-like protein